MHAIIFRKRLLSYTETFIAEQAQKLPTWTPIFTGFKQDMKGFGLIEQKKLPAKQYEVCFESEHSILPAITAAAHKRFGIINKQWQRKLESFSPKVIHAHFGPDALAAIPLSKRLNIPLVTTFHGFDITIDTPMNSYRKNRHHVFSYSTKIIAVSKFIEQKLIDKGCPKEKIIQHYIGVDTDVFKPSEQLPENGRFLFVGRLVKKKGAEYLIKAFHEAIKTNPNIKLRIVGDGPLMEELKTLTENIFKKGNPNAITFVGKLPPEEVQKEIQQAQALCAPSITDDSGDQEGLPISILESLSSGTPVIATYSAGIAEAVEDDKNGYLVKEKDIEGIAKAIISISQNNETRDRLAKEARKKAVENFNLNTQCEKLERIYESAYAEFI